MIEWSKQLKVYSYAKPYGKNFDEEQFETVGQFKHAVQKWFHIPIDQQKLVRDGKVIEEMLMTSPFRQLSIRKDSHLVLLTKTPITIKNKNLHMAEDENVKILNCLSDMSKNNLVTHFIKSLNIPRGELLLLDEKKLHYIIKKICKNRPFLKQMLISKLQVLKLALIDQQKLQYTAPSLTVPSESVDYLISLKYSQADAVRALQICRNDLYVAIELLRGRFKQSPIQFKFNQESLISQYLSISEWIQEESNGSFLLYLSHKPSDLSIFMNHYKHTCPQLFNLIIKWQYYLPDLINYHSKGKM